MIGDQVEARARTAADGNPAVTLSLGETSRTKEPTASCAPTAIRPRLLLVFTGVGLSTLMTTAILLATGGHFEYALDDPYIHLRLSQMIAHGTYGINPGVAASPSSSILWPFLLVPFAGTPFHPYAPLAISVLSLIGTLLVAFRGLAPTWQEFDPAGVRRAAIIGLGGLLLNWFGLPFTGLEHSLHVLTAVGCAAGLLALCYRGAAPWWLWLSIVVCPLVRYEGIAISVVTLLAVAALGRWRSALATAAVLAVPIAVFTGFLTSLGLPPLPDSVVAKWGPARGHFSVATLLGQAVANWVGNLTLHTSVILLFAVCLAATVAVAGRARRRSVRVDGTVPVSAATGALLLHLAFGGDGGYPRYGIYALSYACVLLLGALAPVVAEVLRSLGMLSTLLIAATLALFSSPMYIIATVDVPGAAQEIYDQQHQMHVFAVDYLRAPVAVNDIGEVSYDNPWQVVDLWGLGSNDALMARLDQEPHWISRLVDPHRVPAAMVYSDWFGSAIPATWVRVGIISVTSSGPAAETSVDVYATSPESVPRVSRALRLFGRTTPPRTHVVVTVTS